MSLKQADKIEILTILDNTIDMLMACTPKAKRFPLRPDTVTREVLIAGRGFAEMVTVSSGNTCALEDWVDAEREILLLPERRSSCLPRRQIQRHPDPVRAKREGG